MRRFGLATLFEALGATLAGALSVACSSSSASSSSASATLHPLAGPCATRGGTYLVQFVEQAGNCGMLPPQTITIGSDGTPSNASSFSCKATSQNGCTVTATDCAAASGTYNLMCVVSTDLTYVMDGSSATGTETLACTAAQNSSCTSMYAITETRQ